MLISSKIKNGINGNVKIPGDKSISHRSIIIPSISKGTSEISNLLWSEDVLNTLNAFKAMGVEIEEDKKKVSIKGKGLNSLVQPKHKINLGNSGTSARLLIGLLSSQNFNSTLVGDNSLSKRPMERITKPLELMGAKFASNNNKLPLKIIGQKLNNINYELKLPSAQVKSGLIFAALNTEGTSKIIEKNITRDHTEIMLQFFDANIKIEKINYEKHIFISGKKELSSKDIIVPSDLSSAAFFIVAALINENSHIKIDNIKLIDLYHLSMGQVYWRKGNKNGIFNLFFRPNIKRPYYVLSGIDDAIDKIINFKFNNNDILYLKSLSVFDDDFLNFLMDFKFTGSIRAMKEGTIFFPNEPVIEINSPILEGQLLETLLINEIHFQTTLATKASRIVNSSKSADIIDFSARRTYGTEASLKASRNSYISGFTSTSNVEAGKIYDIPLAGTMGHSYILSFENEFNSYEEFLLEFPDNLVFLVDTYDTIDGINNVIKLTKNYDCKVKAVRLDSGDIKSLSFKAREMLDNAGLNETKIIASGSMDEYSINKLINQNNCPIDIFGVGSNYGVSVDLPVMECVYKLVETEGRPVSKNSLGKQYLPYSKQVYRYYENNILDHDIVTKLDNILDKGIPLIDQVFVKGDLKYSKLPIDEIRTYVANQFRSLPEEYKDLYSAEKFNVEVKI